MNLSRFAKRLIKEQSGSSIGVKVLDPAGWVIEPISCGVDAVDVAGGIGGFPLGRIVVLHGPEGGGKTTLAWHVIAVVQQLGGLGVFLDLENKADLHLAAKIGVKVDELVLAVPEYIEEGLAYAEKTILDAREESKDAPIVVVWDSLHAAKALARKKEKPEEEGDKRAQSFAKLREKYKPKPYSPEARAYNSGLRDFEKVLARQRALFVAVSQVRVKVDDSVWGDHETVAVGKAANHYATQTIKFDHKRRYNVDGPKGEEVTITFIKNQVAEPYRRAKISLDYGVGFNRVTATWRAACMLGLARAARKGGSWQVFSLDGKDYKVQGESGFLRLVDGQPGLVPALSAAVHESIRAGGAKALVSAGEEEPEVVEDETPPEETSGE